MTAKATFTVAGDFFGDEVITEPGEFDTAQMAKPEAGRGSDPFQESINQMGIAEETLVPDPVLLITQAKTERLIKKLSIKYGSLVVCLKVLKDFDKSRLYFLGLIRLKRPFPL